MLTIIIWPHHSDRTTIPWTWVGEPWRTLWAPLLPCWLQRSCEPLATLSRCFVPVEVERSPVRHLQAKRLIILDLTRNSSEDEIANVNFLTDDIVHALQNTTDLYTNSTTDRHRYLLERRFTKVSEIMQCNGYYAVQRHSRSPILVPIESS